MRKKFNKLVVGVLTATMAFSFVPGTLPTFVPVTVKAAETGTVDPATCKHLHTDEIELAKSTCTEKGHYQEICKDCGTILDDWEEPAVGHRWKIENSVVTKEATCTEAGERVYTCINKVFNCTATKTETIPATGHKCIYKVVKEPTCNETGLKAYVCTVCGEIQTNRLSEELPKTDHKWDNGKVTKEPTTTSEGTKTYTCETCGETKEETLAKLPSTPTTDSTTPGTEPSTKPSDGTTTAKPSTKPSDGTTTAKPSTKPSNGTTTAKPSTKPVKTTVKAGTKLTVAGNTYVVSKANSEVRFSKAKSGLKSLSIPNTIKAKGITFKVTGVSTNAVKNNKKLKTVTIGANVKSIASKAFNNCPNLKKVTIKSTKLTKKTANKKSFNKVNKKMVIKVPSKVKKSYKKIFKGFTVK